MSTDWRKLGLFLSGVGALYIILVSVVADITQMLTLKYGGRLLVLLFITVLFYKIWKKLQKHWLKYRVSQAKLREVRDFIMRSTGVSSNIVMLCARTRWLFQRDEHSIRVSEHLPGGSLMLDVSHISLVPSNLMGMHFRILSTEKERAKGIVITCDPTQACIKLYDVIETPLAGDMAVPIEPPEAKDLERLLGNILFIVSE